MSKIENGIGNVREAIDLASKACDIADTGTNTIKTIKSGEFIQNFNTAFDIREKTSSMKVKYVIAWVLMIVATVVICIVL